MHVQAAVAVPVGPDARELDRLKDLVDSLRAHVPTLAAIALVDDAPVPRPLEDAVGWRDPELVVLRTPKAAAAVSVNDAHAAGTLTLLRWLAAQDRADYLVKLDTDSLVIADFRPSIERAMRREPHVGVWGAYRENEPGGGRRDFSYWRGPLRKAIAPARLRLRGRVPVLEQAVTGRAARSRRFVRSVLRDAGRNGYELGEHCLGAAYAVTAQAARRMSERGYLDDPLSPYRTRLGEDVVVGMLVRACGLRLGSLVARGEAFALRHRGLLAEPDELAARGHAVIHSVKTHPTISEPELRTHFGRRRHA
jgi:hypothetical protein